MLWRQVFIFAKLTFFNPFLFAPGSIKQEVYYESIWLIDRFLFFSHPIYIEYSVKCETHYIPVPRDKWHHFGCLSSYTNKNNLKENLVLLLVGMFYVASRFFCSDLLTMFQEHKCHLCGVAKVKPENTVLDSFSLISM